MPFEKGTEVWKLRENPGRKTAREEAEKILNMNLANSLYNDRLEVIEKKEIEERTDQELNDFVKPVVLKGLPDKVNANFKYEPAIFDLGDDKDDKDILITKKGDISAAKV